MFSKTDKSARIDSEQREQFQYARARVQQKKRLVQHLLVFIAGGLLLTLINRVFGFGDEFFIKNWSDWVVLIWLFILLVHFFNVFILNKFMDKEWEDRQLEKLKQKQSTRIAELEAELKKTTQAEPIKKNETPPPPASEIE